MLKAKRRFVSLLTACLTALLALVLGLTAWFAPTPITTASAATETSVTLAIKGNTGVMSGTTSISWTQGDVKFTNVKGGTAIRTSDSDHYRAYSGSKNTISVSEGTIKKIVITCTSSEYANVCKTSATNANATVSVSSSVVTITPPASTGSEFTFTSSAQWRLKQIVVTYEISDACTHENATENITTPPSCTTAGKKTITCNNCGNVETKEIPATGHLNTTEAETVAPTCTVVGEKTITCEDCGNVETKEIPATGHNFVSGRCSVCGEKEPTTKTDVLTRAITSVSGSNYAAWSNKSVSTEAVYAGNSAGGNDSIQLRSNNNSGIITTTSGGQAKKISVEWNSNTSAGRTLNIYGKNSAYSAATDLYNSNQGTLIGTIVYGSSTELEISDEYAYIGLRSASGAMYITSISITWETTGCSHDNTREEITTDPTCTEAGSMSIVCDDCEATISTEEIPATGHNLDAGVVTTPPQAGVEGVMTYTCQNEGCDYTETDSIPALDAETFVVSFLVPAGIDNVPDSEAVISGDTVTLPEANDRHSYVFVGWVAEEQDVTSSLPEFFKAGSEYTVTENVTLYALYSYSVGSGNYVKVTEDRDDWSGNYLIVYEKGNSAYIFNAVDTANGYVSATTDGTTIVYSDAIGAEEVTLAKVSDGYSVLTKNGYIAGISSANKLNFSDSATKNTLTFTDKGFVRLTAGRTLQFNSASSDMRFRYYTVGNNNIQEVYLYALDGTNYYTTNVDCRSDIDSASATVEADITLNYYVELAEEFVENTTMQFVIGENMYEVAPIKENGGDRYFFPIPVGPHFMTANITASLVCNGVEVDRQENYSVQQYAQNKLNDSPSDELRALLTAMLYYGDAAQAHEGLDVNTTAGVEGMLAVSTPTINEDNKMSLVTNASECTAWFESANVWFSSENKIRLTINTTENVTLSINDGAPVAVTDTIIYTKGVAATQLGEKVKFELYQNGELMQTLYYSVYSYAYSKRNSSNEPLKNLVLALYRYGEAAVTYRDAQ